MNTVKKIGIVATGSRGDVQPAIALGKALQVEGYQVIIIAASNFTEWIASHHLESLPFALDVADVLNSPEGLRVTNSGANPLTVLRTFRQSIDKFGTRDVRLDIWEKLQAMGEIDLLISATMSDVYTVALNRILKKKHMTMPLQPSMVATRDGRSLIAPLRPTQMSRLNYWATKPLEHFGEWYMTGNNANQLCAEIGFPPLTRQAYLAIRKRLPTLHGYSTHVAPRPADWPENYHVTGYWFLDEGADWQPPAALTQFLATGRRPICIGFGSMTNANPKQMTRLIIDAVQQSGERAVLLSGWAGLGKEQLPPEIFAIPHAAHDWLFERVSAVIHHGGAGTTAAGLRAGKPTVIVPHLADQPYWGRRIYELGIGPKPIPKLKLTANKLTQAIQAVVSTAAYAENAAALGHKIKQENGMANAIAHIKRVLGDV